MNYCPQIYAVSSYFHHIMKFRKNVPLTSIHSDIRCLPAICFYLFSYAAFDSTNFSFREASECLSCEWKEKGWK